jgi:hypothetical protein
MQFLQSRRVLKIKSIFFCKKEKLSEVFPMAQAGLVHSKRVARQKFFKIRCTETKVSLTVKETSISIHYLLKYLCLAKRLEHRREAKSLHYLLSKI